MTDLAAGVAVDVLRASATELAAAIRERRVTSREVVQRHIDRLDAFHARTNAVVVPLFEDALALADRADERVAEGGELPPLLGVPCTIKECFELEGRPNTSGLVSRRGLSAEATAPAVQRLLYAGAIPLGLTNTSELCMWWESCNRVYGRTSCAYSARRTAGGSSGGEGAAVGSGGSPFGLGSDIGGSIRIPAFFNGVFGHKPSPGLVPNEGQFPCAKGPTARMLATGPLARRAEDLMPLLRILAGPLGGELGDPAEVRIEALRVLSSGPPGPLPVRADLRRAQARAEDHLRAAGAEVARTRLRGMARGFEMLIAGLSTDETVFSELLGGGTPRPPRELIAETLRRRSPHILPSVFLAVAELARDATPRRTRRLLDQARRLGERTAATIGDGVLLYPSHPRVAPLHSRSLLSPWACAYTGIFNVMGLPATQVPLGLNARGIPVGIQVVAAPGNDHVAIAVAIELERRGGGWMPPAP